MINIIQHLEKPILIQSTFIKAKIDNFDSQYFINKLEDFLKENNLNNLTNVKGQMTNWTAFLNDEYLSKIIFNFLTHIEYNFGQNLQLTEAWGIKMQENNYTRLHNHVKCDWSAILYLNNCSTPLIFPESNIEVYPEPGLFVFFSGFMKHKTTRIKKNEVKYAIPCNFSLVGLPQYNKDKEKICQYQDHK